MTAPSPRARLRNRIVVRVGVLVAVLSAGLGVATYLVVRDALIDERQVSAADQLTANGRLLASALRSADVDEGALLASLRPRVRASELLLRNEEWSTASLRVQPADLPRTLVDSVVDGQAARQRFRVDGDLMLGVGVALPDGEGAYFEVFDLSDISSTLDTLRTTLLAAGAVATMLGMALGWWIARRVTRPLEQLSGVAARIAEGELGTRMDTSADEDLARIATSFNHMADSLQERIDRESRFAADVSHELRSPMTTLLTSLTVLERRRNELSAEGQEALDLLTRDMRRFERMVADLIEISKHDAGTATADVDVARLVDTVHGLLRKNRRETLPLHVEEGAERAVVRLDPRRFERALLNVIENAEAYAGGVSRIVVAAGPDVARVTVEDRGPGIPEAELDLVFDRFARGTEGRRVGAGEGSGLGLSLSRENMSMFGGRVWAEPGLAVGAHFVLELPRVE